MHWWYVAKSNIFVSKNPHVLKLTLRALRVIKNTAQVNKQCELNLRVNTLEKMEFAVVLQWTVASSAFFVNISTEEKG